MPVSEVDRRRAPVPLERKRYSRIPEVLPIPDLIELQRTSYDWFVEHGLRDLLDEISPIPDFTGKSMELHFNKYEFGEPKYDQLECRARDLTYAKPLYVEVELLIKETGEHIAQRVYMGDFPTMTERGTFIINGAERVVVSQLVRSPGVYYTGHRGPHHRPPPLQRQGHPQPRRLAGVRDRRPQPALRQGRPQAQARGHQAAARRGLRVQRGDAGPLRARSTPARSATSARRSSTDATEHAHGSAHRGLQEAAPRRPAHRRQRREARRVALLQLPPLRPRPRRPLQAQQEAGRRWPTAWASSCPRSSAPSPARTSPPSSATSSSSTTAWAARTTSTTSATAASAPTAS